MGSPLGFPFTLIFWRIRQTTVTVMYFTLMNDSDRETAVFIQISHMHKKVVLNENTLILNLFNCAIFRILYHVTLVLISMVTMVILCSPPLSHLILSLVEQMAQMTFLHPVWISPVFSDSYRRYPCAFGLLSIPCACVFLSPEQDFCFVVDILQHESLLKDKYFVKVVEKFNIFIWRLNLLAFIMYGWLDKVGLESYSDILSLNI